MALSLTTTNPIPRYQFPLSDQEDYKGRIVIECVQENYQTIVNKFTSAQAALNYAAKDALDAFGGIGPSVRTQTLAKEPPIRQGIVQLYLPQALQFADGVSYTNVDLGALGGLAALGIRSGASGAQAAAKALEGINYTFQSLSDAVTNGLKSEPAQVAALRTVGRLNEGVRGAIETETGITLNPNRRSTFQGVGVRRFNFTFSMIPNSPEEARMIKEIIGFFRLQMYPSTYGDLNNPVTIEGASVAFKFPAKFNIKLLYGNKRVGTGILPCFLSDLEVAYNPNSMGFHKDGEVQETQLTLRFVEERALTQTDIIKDNTELGLTARSSRGA